MSAGYTTRSYTHFYSLNPTINNTKWWSTSDSQLLHDKKQGMTNRPNRTVFSLFSMATHFRKRNFVIFNRAVKLSTSLAGGCQPKKRLNQAKYKFYLKENKYDFILYFSRFCSPKAQFRPYRRTRHW